MGSEVFNLKSLYLEDTVVRGARINFKNANTTKTLIVNNGDDSILKTGETGINKEYVVEASLVGNDLKGFGTVVNNSDVISSYTGPQNISNGDLFRLNGDKTFYGVTGIQGTNIYLTDKYAKEETTGPDTQSGVCVLRKVKINSVKYETVYSLEGQNFITYEKNNADWETVLGQATGPNIVGYTGVQLDDGMAIKLQEGNKKDLITIGTVYKTLVKNNTSAIQDISLSPLPYPHSSLQVYYAPSGGELTKQVEFENYAVNYSQNPELLFPYPPYEERTVAYIKFLDKMIDEIQVPSIDSSFNGQLQLVKKSNQPGNLNLTTSVQDIMPSEGFSMKVGGSEKKENVEYIPNYSAGLVTFVKHVNEEQDVNYIAYPKTVFWDGLSVIKGVGETDLKDPKNLVIPGITGIEGTTGIVYYEDIEDNNLIRDVDFKIDFGSGAFNITKPLKETESVLVSYYVEGLDIENEVIDLKNMRTKEYPIVSSSVTLTQIYDSLGTDGNIITKKSTLIEGDDYEMFYVTGRINIIKNVSGEVVKSYEAAYTPMAQLNCIMQSIPGQEYRYRMTIVDDILNVPGDLVSVKDKDALAFIINNPVVSVPVKDPFKDTSDPTRYSFDGTITQGSLLSVKDITKGISFDPKGYSYDDLSRQIKLDTALSEERPESNDIITATYSFESDLIPYAPLLVFFPVLKQGENTFVIEGFDRTDVLYPDSVMRIKNFNPENIYYFKVKSVKYKNSNTIVEFYDSFPEDIQNPSISLIDKPVVWVSLPAGTYIDTGVAVGSEAILLQNNVLMLNKDIKVNSLIQINGTQIYEVQTVAVSGNSIAIQLFPVLREPIFSIVYTQSPIYDQGAEEIVPDYSPITDTPEPAFKLSYVSPVGFEGSASILLDKEKIVLQESIRGFLNPKPYEFKISDYPTVYELAKVIMGTSSTFSDNLPMLGVPQYNPFSIAPNSKTEDYYLAPGVYRSDLLIPFENADIVNLPYTFTISTEVRKYSLLQLKKGIPYFDIFNANQTSYFSQGNVIAFQSKYSGAFEYHEVLGAALVNDSADSTIKDTRVTLKDSIKANDIDPNLLKVDSVAWLSCSYSIVSIDYAEGIITFSGAPTYPLRKSQLFKINDSLVYKIVGVSIGSGLFSVSLSSSIESTVKSQNYLGYIKHSVTPVVGFETGDQPYVWMTYTVPKAHTGFATVDIDDEKITLNETIDNYTHHSNVYKFSDYTKLEDLLVAIRGTSSMIVGDKPFNAIASSEGLLLKDIRLTPVIGRALDTAIYISFAAFSISYELPVGPYTGKAEIKITDTTVELKETVKFQSDGNTVVSDTVIHITDSTSLKNLVVDVIPKLRSLILTSTIYPYKTVLMNTDFFGEGIWDTVSLTAPVATNLLPTNVYGNLKLAYFGSVGILNEKRLELTKDYTLETGAITLTKAMNALDRFKFSYMGLDNRAEEELKDITCSCRFFKTVDKGSQVDIYMDYLNIDQFYIQKLTERKFSEIVVVPQILEIINQKGSGGGFGNDSGASDEAVPNWNGGTVNDYYFLRDELIKKQLYIRFFQWYKSRLRNFSAELQMLLGFKFAHSTSIGINNGAYSLADEDVEDTNYTLTRTSDFNQVKNGYNKFFPVDYDGTAPRYYSRFGTEYLAFNEVYCCNVKYMDGGVPTTVGIVKSDRPYWNRTSDLDYNVWLDKYIKEILVGSYTVPVPITDRVFSSSSDKYSFLRTIEESASIKIDTFNDYHAISFISTPTGKTYEYLQMKSPFSEKGVRLYDLTTMVTKDKDRHVIKDSSGNPVRISFDTLMDTIPPDGYRIWVKRPSPESFPMCDDNGSLGASAQGGYVEGIVKNTRKIKKPFGGLLLAILFPFADFEPTKSFRIMVKKDPEGPWELLGTGDIDLAKLSFSEERNLDDVMDALRFDFEEKFAVGAIKVYDIKEKSGVGLHEYFYISIEKVYDEGSRYGYYEGLNLRAKDRNWTFRIEDAGDQDIVEEYGFVDYQKDNTSVYEGFYDPNNIYKTLLREKQAWETEGMVIKDLYDFNDKLARAFNQGNLGEKNKLYQGYLASPEGGTTKGITDTLKDLIPLYEGYLQFLLSSQGPVQGIISPDYVHDEDNASPDIAKSYKDAKAAHTYYQDFYNLEKFYENMNNNNNNTWRNDYVRWCLGLRQGIIYQKDARNMYDMKSGVVTVGISQQQAIGLTLFNNGLSTLTDAVCTIGSDYNGKILRITANIDGSAKVFVFDLYKFETIDTVTTVVYKKIKDIVEEINSYNYSGGDVKLFKADNVFKYQDNNILVNAVIDIPLFLSYNVGSYVNVTNVEDHRASDPRVLFLGKNIEDYLYTSIIRNQTAFTLKYNGSYYQQAYDKRALNINATKRLHYPAVGFTSLLYIVSLNKSSKKRLTIRGQYTYGFFADNGDSILAQVNIETFIELYDSTTGTYKTIQQVIDEINQVQLDKEYVMAHDAKGRFLNSKGVENVTKNYAIPYYSRELGQQGTFITLTDLGLTIFYSPDFKINLFMASAAELPVKDSTSSMAGMFSAIPAIDVTDSTWLISPLSHINNDLDNLSQNINQGIYRIYYDSNLNKQLEIKFNEVIVGNANSSGVAEIFTFSFNNDDGSFKTLNQFAEKVNSFVYKQASLFSVVVNYPDKPNGELSSRYVLADNKESFLGFDMSTTIYADIYIQKTQEGAASSRDVNQSKNAYLAFPFYTANGNHARDVIEDVPVSGAWDPTQSEQVLEVSCISGAKWEVTFSDYVSGDYKAYTTPQEIIDSIANTGLITAAQEKFITTLENQPTVPILKKMVLTKKSDTKPKVYKILLRQYPTLNDLANAINTESNKGVKDQDLAGLSADFHAVVKGSPEIQGNYKSYELDATYVPIVKDFGVIQEPLKAELTANVSYYNNRLVGWKIAPYMMDQNVSHSFTISSKRYSSSSSFKFKVNDPKLAYESTLNKMPIGYSKDILAFDIYCWDDADFDGNRRYTIKDNWIYLQSKNVGYSFDTDLGQPIDTHLLGYGIPLVGSGHVLVDEKETMDSLLRRINNNAQINKWFYANLKFTRDIKGTFEYGYLPNYASGLIPKAVLDNFYLRDDSVLSLTPGQGYTFNSCSYTVHDTLNTIDLSCNWSMPYTYQKTYNLSNGSHSTINGLVSALNTDLAPIIPASVFQAQAVVSHGADASTTLLAASNNVVEVSENFTTNVSSTFTVDVVADQLITHQMDWRINDIVRVTSTGTLPSPLLPGVDYYIISSTLVNGLYYLKISTTLGGLPINILNSGTGVRNISTHRILVTLNDWHVNDIVRFTTTGTLPSPLALSTDYYVESVYPGFGVNILNVSSTLGGSPISITNMGVGIHTLSRQYVDLMANTLSNPTPYAVILLKVRNMTGAKYKILNAFYKINTARNQMEMRVDIQYSNNYVLTGYNYSAMTLSQLATNLSNIKDLTDSAFGPLFNSTLISESFSSLSAARLKDASGTSLTKDTQLDASLSDIIAMKVLSMDQKGSIAVGDTSLRASTTKVTDTNLPADKNIQEWILGILKGDYTTGLLKQDILPMIVEGVTYGWLEKKKIALTYTNVPEHVYFGVLGDIKWVQISDHNLHIQLNYVKQRLGQPWKDSSGIVRPDYYTPESFNSADNKYAIDADHFLNWLKSTRFLQIKNSIINEGIIQNKYLWIYMKLHKEFGCDQRAIALQKRIATGESDQSVMEGLG